MRVRHGYGSRGWPEAVPFDTLAVTAAPREVPAAPVARLTPGGRLVIPVGGGGEHEPVEFVPMIIGP